MLYGDYLAELLAEAGIEAVRGEAVDLADGVVLLANGGTIAADAVVLAPGNFKPATPRGIDPAALGPLWVDDPWAEGIAEGLGRGDIVLLLGTGLTAVDAALTLEAAGFRRAGSSPCRGAASRRAPTARASRWSRRARICRRPAWRCCGGCAARSEEIGWRSAVHELRTVTQELWGAASVDERRRFLRHLRPWWDVHRHKLAPAVGATIEAMQGAARLAVAAGKLVSAEAEGDRAVVRFRARGKDEVETLRVARIVNCTGPGAGHRPRRASRC